MSDVDAGCIQTAANETADSVSCDGEDNDCDNMIDEGTNLNIDPANCGTCGIRCSLVGVDGSRSSGLGSLLLFGIAGLGLRRRRRKKRA